jgi:hypothetical protein
MSITGNETRDSYIRAAVAEARALGHEMTTVNVNACLPDIVQARGDFDLLPEEVTAFANESIVNAEFTEVTGEVQATEQPDAGAPNEAPEPQPRRPVTQPDIERAQNAVADATNALQTARVGLTIAGRKELESIEARNRAISQFTSGFQPYSFNQLVHDNAVAAREERRQRASGELVYETTAKPAASKIDEMNFPYPGRGSVDSGAGRGYRRTVMMGGTGQKIHGAERRGWRVPSDRG